MTAQFNLAFFASFASSVQCTPQQCLPYTVFAPNNAAFAKLPTSVLNNLLANPAQLAQVLKYHLLDHRVYSTQISDGSKVSAAGVSVARAPAAPYPACKGVLHSSCCHWLSRP